MTLKISRTYAMKLLSAIDFFYPKMFFIALKINRNVELCRKLQLTNFVENCNQLATL